MYVAGYIIYIHIYIYIMLCSYVVMQLFLYLGYSYYTTIYMVKAICDQARENQACWHIQCYEKNQFEVLKLLWFCFAGL